MSPGRKPRRSPASTAGRVSTMRPTSPGLERLHRGADREIGLAAAGRSQRQRQIMLPDRRHQPALTLALRADLAAPALFALRFGRRDLGRPAAAVVRCAEARWMTEVTCDERFPIPSSIAQAIWFRLPLIEFYDSLATASRNHWILYGLAGVPAGCAGSGLQHHRWGLLAAPSPHGKVPPPAILLWSEERLDYVAGYFPETPAPS